jgi:hypothetical protein
MTPSPDALPPQQLEPYKDPCLPCRNNANCCLILGDVRKMARKTWINPVAKNLEDSGQQIASSAIELQTKVLANPTGVSKEQLYAAENTVDPTGPNMRLAEAGRCPQLEHAATLYRYFHELVPKQQ